MRSAFPLFAAMMPFAAMMSFAAMMLIVGGCAAPVIAPNARGAHAGSVSRPESPGSRLERLLYPKRVAWRQWGESNLQTGDLVFTRGNYYLLLGAINFSDFLSTVSASPFSHVGIVAIEDGQAMVYDISDSGLRSAPFGRYVTESRFEQIAVRRPIPELYPVLPEVIGFIRQKQTEGVRFDSQFDLDNDSLYCSELIVKAFAASGVEIAEPLQAGELPGLSDVSPWSLTLARLATGLELTDPVYTIGNASSGLYGCSQLVDCLPPTDL